MRTLEGYVLWPRKAHHELMAGDCRQINSRAEVTNLFLTVLCLADKANYQEEY